MQIMNMLNNLGFRSNVPNVNSNVSPPPRMRNVFVQQQCQFQGGFDSPASSPNSAARLLLDKVSSCIHHLVMHACCEIRQTVTSVLARNAAI